MKYERLDALAMQLKSMRPLNETELRVLRDEFIVENTYNSNAIEGNSLTLRETSLILQAGITIGEKPIKDHLEAIGHKDAFEYVISLADSNTVLSERTIKEVHSLVLMNDRLNRGVYRSLPVSISGAMHMPPQPYLVPIQMEQLMTDYEEMKSHLHPLAAISELHLRFEGIHPFIDGNGRTGRLVLNLELIKAGFLPINIKYADRMRYYACFDEYFGPNHSSSALVEMIVAYEEEELEKRLTLLKAKEFIN